MSPCSGHWTPGWQPAHLRWTRFCSWQFLPHMAAVALWRGQGTKCKYFMIIVILEVYDTTAACPWPETGYTFIHDTPLPRINFTMLCAENVQKVTSANCWKYLRFSTGPISTHSLTVISWWLQCWRLLCLGLIVRLVITIVGRSGDDKLVTVPRRYGHYGHTMATLRCIMASLWTPVIPLSAPLHYHPIVAAWWQHTVTWPLVLAPAHQL